MRGEVRLASPIVEDISEYTRHSFQEDSADYLCVYGSSVYKRESSYSDIDIFVVTDDERIAVGGLIAFISRLHAEHSLKIDEEVPYENKVRYTSGEIDSAIAYGGFNVEGETITVPPVEKNPQFLNSKAIKARLALNALTTPHIVYGYNLQAYALARMRAEDAVTLLGIHLLEKEEFDVKEVHDCLAEGPDGRSGEMYLGYKVEHSAVSEYLLGLIDDSVDRLSRDNVIRRHNNTFNVPDGFSPYKYMTMRK